MKKIPKLFSYFENGEKGIQKNDLLLFRLLLVLWYYVFSQINFSSYAKFGDTEAIEAEIRNVWSLADSMLHNNRVVDITLACAYAILAFICFGNALFDKMPRYLNFARTLFHSLKQQHHPYYKQVLMIHVFTEKDVCIFA